MKHNNMIQCLIVSNKKAISYKNLRSIALPAYSGEVQILPGHVEYFGLLKIGDIILEEQNNQKNIVSIKNGEYHIKNNILTIIL